ncbi:DUF928 domain-containing protein [Methylomonas sp. 2BW1-5-20]|uniref:DUF928 domain-containing protein n=1 Tax=Methylomonas sp. 2BW1-5-20 TaxID=3376686 RepID=UPI004051C4DE
MLSRRRLVLLGLLMLCLAPLADLLAGENDRTSSPAYKPPPLGAPSPNILVGGGTRTLDFAEQADPDSAAGQSVVALAPKQTGLTAHAEPTLFWWTKHTVPVILTLGSSTQSSTVQFSVPERDGATNQDWSGLGRIPLAEQGFRLKQNVEYRWAVASGDRRITTQSSGTIVYREPSAELKGKLDHADRLEQARLYALAGYWYDAVQILLELTEAKPQNSQRPREVLLQLLADAELELPGLIRISPVYPNR